jgi:hypothetical protein
MDLRRRRSGALIALACLVAISAFWGCGNDSSAGKDLQVTNAPDNFQFQVTGMKHYTKTYVYSWSNSGTAASVNQACSISEGLPTLSIRDAANTLVYSRDLRQNGTYPTSAGTSGTWKITLTVTDVSGTLNFRVQKAP